MTDNSGKGANLCANCGERPKEKAPSPKDYVNGKHITIFGWTIIIYRETIEYYDNLCNDCLVDRSQANERDRIEPALDDAYNKGYEDGLKNL